MRPANFGQVILQAGVGKGVGKAFADNRLAFKWHHLLDNATALGRVERSPLRPLVGNVHNLRPVLACSEEKSGDVVERRLKAIECQRPIIGVLHLCIDDDENRVVQRPIPRR